MIKKEADKCLEYLANETSGLSVRHGNTGKPWDDSVQRWFPSELTWWDWLVKFEADMLICGPNCYKMKVITETFVEDGYPFSIRFISAKYVNTFIEFKSALLYAFELYTKARELHAERLEEWKKDQIKKAAKGYEV